MAMCIRLGYFQRKFFSPFFSWKNVLLLCRQAGLGKGYFSRLWPPSLPLLPLLGPSHTVPQWSSTYMSWKIAQCLWELLTVESSSRSFVRLGATLISIWWRVLVTHTRVVLRESGVSHILSSGDLELGWGETQSVNMRLPLGLRLKKPQWWVSCPVEKAEHWEGWESH